MKEKLKAILGTIIGIAFLFIFFQLVFSIVAFIGGSVMKPFGFYYDSRASVLALFFWSGILGFPLDVLSIALPKALYHLEKLKLKSSRILYFLLDTSFTFFILFLISNYMTDVYATNLALLVVSALFSLPNLWEKFDENPETPKTIEENG